MLENVLELAKRLAEKQPGSVRLTKDLLRNYSADTIQKQKAEEFKNLARKIRSHEGREVFKTFFEKRKPDDSKFK